jgi:predicted phage terminase large subunit-like protein
MAALQYVSVPGYNAILFRKTYSDLGLPGALMDRAKEWLIGKVPWSEQDKRFTFPGSRATLGFGYLETPDDKYRYQSAEYQFVGFDEVTEFDQASYLYLFSRLRRNVGETNTIPLRMRCASNPIGTGFDWVKLRFVDPGHIDRPFVPAKLTDNPFIDQDSYIKSLMNLDPVTRAKLLEGDWVISEEGAMFRAEWFKIVDAVPQTAHRCRYWDLAATEPKKGKDPDWTVGALVSEVGGIYFVEDVKRFKRDPYQVEQAIALVAEMDGKRITVGIEEEQGASGKSLIDHYRRNVLRGFTVMASRPGSSRTLRFGNDNAIKASGSKVARAMPWASAAGAGNVKLMRGDWNKAFLDEVGQFPLSGHDDQVDAVSGAFGILTRRILVPHAGSAARTEETGAPAPRAEEVVGQDVNAFQDILSQAKTPEERNELLRIINGNGTDNNRVAEGAVA